jgi:hypothetical protein
MRLGRKMIDHVAKTITDVLTRKKMLELEVDPRRVTEEVSRVIVGDLMIEDRLNEEIRDILEAHSIEMDRGNIDYSRMFSMVKRTLVRDRGLIL